MDELNPFELDRALAETWARVRRWLQRLRVAKGFDEDPFVFTRWACGRTTFAAVTEMPVDDPLRVPLRRWVYRLSELRVNQLALSQATFELRVAERVVDQPERLRTSLAELLARSVADSARRSHWLAAFQSHAVPFADAVQLLWERRAEVARRMGLESPSVIDAPADDLDRRAQQWLRDTDDAFQALECQTIDQVIGRALAGAANAGWPAQLLLRTLIDLFPQPDLFRSLDLDPGTFAPPIAAASFLRALRRLGAAWVDATAPRDQPFVIAHDAYGMRRRAMGALFGGLPFNPEFARRTLGVSSERLADYRRALAEALLIDSRLMALRWLLRQHALQGAATFECEFEALTARTLGSPVSPNLAGTLFRPTFDSGQCFAGLFAAAHQAHRLMEMHDADWYRNPRAVDQLRSEAALSPELHMNAETLDSGSKRLLKELALAL